MFETRNNSYIYSIHVCRYTLPVSFRVIKLFARTGIELWSSLVVNDGATLLLNVM